MLHTEETDSFGRRLSKKDIPQLATLNFAGGQRDSDTGLIHFLFRDYDPTTGFFIQPDPLGLRGGDVDVYGYCLDDPVNLVDPMGLASVPFYVPQSSVRETIRESAPLYGLTVKCTDEELDDLIRFAPDEKVKEFKKSYDKLPDVGKKLSPEEKRLMRKESRKQLDIIDGILKKWGGGCIQ